MSRITGPYRMHGSITADSGRDHPSLERAEAHRVAARRPRALGMALAVHGLVLSPLDLVARMRISTP